ncbi:MAG: flagellar biosynthesis protein FlhB [SAR324 cluster bacterium]|nr:flagellar biosynthesis protein FlhB [SAR324 cluster bacterium]
MAQQNDGQEKTEAPSDKRREDSRKEGQVAFSKEVSSAATLAGMGMILYAASTYMLEKSLLFLSDSFTQFHTQDFTIPFISQILSKALSVTSPIFLPFALFAMIAGILSSVFQVGFRPTIKPLQPKLNKLSPFNGIKRIFSTQGLAELFKSLFKMIVLGYIGYITFQEELEELMGLSIIPADSIITYNFSLVARVTGKIVLALMVLAVMDYFYQRWQHEQKLKMTKQEVKDEMKQTEGDPQLKSRIRQVQREMSRARMMQEVPQADAVVTNPTHFAVAIRYDRENMVAPQVTAKGADYIALRMRAIAKENNVPVLERPPLARELYRDVEVGEVIPDRFFKAVAEILAYVYRLRKKQRST